MLDVVHDLFLGSAEEMSSSAPVLDPNNPGKLIGGTAFEQCGQQPIKGSGRCYSLTVTHQRAQGLVGPAGSGKSFGNVELSDSTNDEDTHNAEVSPEDYRLNLAIRKQVTKVCHYQLSYIFH